MGHVIKKIYGDVDSDPAYDQLTIELNYPERIHIHLKNIRMDLSKSDYNILYEMIMMAGKKMGWE